MRAAIYVRRSTEEHQQESLDVQLDNARRFIGGRGWTEVGLYQDDGVSRAEFKRRPGLIALLNAAGEGSFDAVVVRDETRIGGDMLRTGLVIQDLADHGVRLFYYATGEQVRVDDATSRFLVAAKNFGAELEREKIASRTREHLERKARRGLVAGGVAYGYRNADGPEGGRVRVVHQEEAEVVRWLVEEYGRGTGLRSLAHELNLRGVAPPRAGRRGTGTWSPSAIREMVRNPLYVGRIEWGRIHKTYQRGTQIRTREHELGVVVVDRPELRIVSDEAWSLAQSRAERHEKIAGTRARGAAPRYMLSGLARCSECGGPIHANNGRVSYDTVKVYGCGWRRDRGAAVCSNSLRRPVATVDAALTGWISVHVLNEEVVRRVLQALRVAMRDRSAETERERPALEAERRRLRIEVDRLVTAVASGTSSAALLSALEAREQQLRELDARLTVAPCADVVDLGVRRLEHEAGTRLADLGQLFTRNPTEARGVLAALLTRPLHFAPITTENGKRFEITGEMSLGGVLRVSDEILTKGVPSGTLPVRNSAERSGPLAACQGVLAVLESLPSLALQVAA